MTKMENYKGQYQIPVKLACGCETTWADGESLYEGLQQDAWCDEHEDTHVEEIHASPTVIKAYKKVTDTDILVRVEGAKGYSIASKNDPEPEGCLYTPNMDYASWKEITLEEASAILGYNVAE